MTRSDPTCTEQSIDPTRLFEACCCRVVAAAQAGFDAIVVMDHSPAPDAQETDQGMFESYTLLVAQGAHGRRGRRRGSDHTPGAMLPKALGADTCRFDLSAEARAAGPAREPSSPRTCRRRPRRSLVEPQGAAVVIAYAVANPERVSHLVLYGSDHGLGTCRDDAVTGDEP